MEMVHNELHDAYIAVVQYTGSQLVLFVSRRIYSYKAHDLVDSKRSRLIFAGVVDLDAQKLKGRTWLSRKPKCYQTARDLLKLAENLPGLRESISLVQRVEDGYILDTNLSAEFYIKASESYVEDWVDVTQESNTTRK